MVYRTGGEFSQSVPVCSVSVGSGLLLKTCEPPGWVLRLWHGVRAGQQWRCRCGTVWHWSGACWRPLD